jgi:flagellin
MLSLTTNLQSLRAQRNWAAAESALATTTERLSSGLRINSARDDAAGLAISQRLEAQIRGMNVAARNAGEAISLAQTAEGGVSAIGDALQRMRELAVQASNATLTSSDRAILQIEVDSLQDEVASLVSDTSFNGRALLTNANSAAIQVGANPGQTVTVQNTNLSALTGAGAGSVTALTVTGNDATNASSAIQTLDSAIDSVASALGQWGAVQNRFDSVTSNLQSNTVILGAARGRILDADFAAETANRARLLILRDSAVAMLAQANTYPQRVLQLLLPQAA